MGRYNLGGGIRCPRKLTVLSVFFFFFLKSQRRPEIQVTKQYIQYVYFDMFKVKFGHVCRPKSNHCQQLILSIARFSSLLVGTYQAILCYLTFFRKKTTSSTIRKSQLPAHKATIKTGVICQKILYDSNSRRRVVYC